MELSNHLPEFVRVFQIMGEISPKDMLIIYTARLVIQHIMKKTPKDVFQGIIETQNLQEKITGASITDFPYGEEVQMEQMASNHGGIWETHVDINNDDEDNAFYAAFSTPMKAYSFMLDAMY